LQADPRPESPRAAPRASRCACGHQLFFDDGRCPGCGQPVGYLLAHRALYRLRRDAGTDTWTPDAAAAAVHPPSGWRRCANHDSPAACNWLIAPAPTAPSGTLCRACRLNRTIPDLSQDRLALLWSRMERAKRRVVSQLVGLGLPVADRVAEDPAHGIAFDFLSALPGQAPVSTGHADGIVTVDVEEADDAVRERTREAMGEPYRTLVGHFRHELGHYYWARLIQGSDLEAPCRQVFGDERADYRAALEANRAHGPPPGWSRSHVSAYASVHPAEDWAESWAHYLHMRDTLETAGRVGIVDDPLAIDAGPFGADDLWDPRAPDAHDFVAMVRRWQRLVGAMNEMSHAMGQPDFYPFALPHAALAKLQFIHGAIERARHAAASRAGDATDAGTD